MQQEYSPFEPIRSFDVPSVALQQLLSGGASLESITSLADPDKRANLSPEQQLSLTEKLKDDYGGDNPVLRTMIGIATNPFIWLGAAVSPAGVDALRKGGTIFGLGRHLSKHVDQNGSLLVNSGITHANALLDGTTIAPGLKVDEHLRRVFKAEQEGVMAESLANAFKGREDEFLNLGMQGVPTNFDEYLEYIARKQGINPKKLTRSIFEGGYVPKDPTRGGRTARHIGTRSEHVKEIVEDITGIEYIYLNGLHKNRTSVIDRLNPTAKIELKGMDPEKAKKFLREARGSEFSKGKRAADDYTGDGVYEISLNRDTGALKGKNYEDLYEENIIARDADETMPHILQPLDHNKMRKVQLTEEVPAIFDEVELQKLIDHYDLQPYLDARRKSYDKSLVMMMGNDKIYKETGRFVADENKLLTLASAFNTHDSAGAVLFNSKNMEMGGNISEAGMDMLSTLMGRDVRNMGSMKAVKDPTQLIEGWVSEATRMFNEGTYVPRNTYAPVTEIHGGVPSSSYKMKGDMNYASLAETTELTPRAMHQRQFHPEAHDWILRKHAQGGVHSGEIVNRVKELKKNAAKTIENNTEAGRETLMMTLDGVGAARRYSKDSSEIWSRFIPHTVDHPTIPGRKILNPELFHMMIQHEERIKKGGGLAAGGGIPFEERFIAGQKWRAKGFDKDGNLIEGEDITTSLLDMINDPSKAPQGGITLADMIGTQWHALSGADRTKELVRDVIIPHMSNRATPSDLMMRGVAIKTREMMGRFADGRIGQMIEGFGPQGKEFISSVREMGEFKDPAGVLAKGLYVGFLGLNMSSVMLNMMQPLIHASMYGGLDSVLPAYKDAFMEIMTYAKNRAAIPRLRLTAEEYADLHRRSFKHVGEGPLGDVLGMTPDVMANLEGVSYAAGQAYGKESGLKYATMTLPMKLFEKAELMNRLVSAHTVDRMYMKAGRRVPHALSDAGTFIKDDALYSDWLSDVSRFVQETQFGGSPLNMPLAFMGAGPAGPILSNPLMRMFLNFQTRAFSSWITTGKQISPTRRIRGTDMEIPYWAGDAMRVMGVGALGYEIGKEVFGMDMSRGLGMGPMTELFGGAYTPPVIKIPLDAWQVMKGDLELAKSSVPGILPGGIGLIRAMGMMPDLGNQPFLPEMAGALQREYVNWDVSTSDGMVPVYKADGTLVNYDKPFNIIMKGLGINLGSHPKAGEVDGYLVKQREMIIKMENDYIMSLMNNNIPKAQGIKRQFEKKFGVPMKISKSQLRSKMRSLRTSRTERIANTIPEEYRDMYTSTLQEHASRMGMSEEDVLLGNTSRRRTTAGAERTNAVKLDPETIAEIKKQLQQQEIREKPIEEQSFNPFRPWNP